MRRGRSGMLSASGGFEATEPASGGSRLVGLDISVLSGMINLRRPQRNVGSV